MVNEMNSLTTCDLGATEFSDTNIVGFPIQNWLDEIYFMAILLICRIKEYLEEDISEIK